MKTSNEPVKTSGPLWDLTIKFHELVAKNDTKGEEAFLAEHLLNSLRWQKLMELGFGEGFEKYDAEGLKKDLDAILDAST